MLFALSLSHPLLFAVAAVPVTYFATVALGRWLHRRQGVQLGFLYQLFCIALALWIPVVAQRELVPESVERLQLDVWLPHLTTAVVLLATFFFIALVKRSFWELWYERRHKTKAPKFLSQLAGLIIFITAALLAVAFNYGVSIPGLVTGSTVLAAILGFALQDLLGNIIAGIALEIGKPFRPGDWLILDHQRLEVIEVNWRSTRLRNNDDVYLDLPNKTIAGATITNLTYLTRQHASRIRVGFERNVPPNFIKDCLVRAAANARGVLKAPPPRVYLNDFGESSIIYEIKFWLQEEANYNDIADAIRTNIWYEAQRNRIRIPFPVRTLQMERNQPRQSLLDVARASTRKQPFLQLLDGTQIERLLKNARLLRFGRGEKIIEQGAEGNSMFVFLEGEADVLVQANGHDTRVGTLRTGDYCGEMSLLTGAPRSATVIARRDCELWEVEKSVLAEILQENQTLVKQLSERLAERRMENEGILASVDSSPTTQTKQKEYTENFLKKLYSFFEL